MALAGQQSLEKASREKLIAEKGRLEQVYQSRVHSLQEECDEKIKRAKLEIEKRCKDNITQPVVNHSQTWQLKVDEYKQSKEAELDRLKKEAEESVLVPRDQLWIQQTRLQGFEGEIQRMRAVNEALRAKYESLTKIMTSRVGAFMTIGDVEAGAQEQRKKTRTPTIDAGRRMSMDLVSHLTDI